MMFKLALLSLVGLACASPIVRSTKWRRDGLQGLDFQLVNLARNLESLELNYWNQGLDNFTDQDFNDAGYDGFRTYLELFRDQEIAHFSVLDETLGGGFENCTYTFPVNSPYDLLSVGQVVTSVGEGAFIGALSLLQNGDASQTAGEILGNEARQNSNLRQYLGLDFFNAVNFDTPLTAPQAYSLAKPFFECPASNPAIEFPLIPALEAAFDNPDGTHRSGDTVQLNWDASVYLGDDVGITFLGDRYSIFTDLNQNEDGTSGTVQLPEGINGTAFLVATNYQGPAPIPDGQNFAIGYLVVA